MASISRTSRFFADMFVGSIPSATMQDAIKYLHKSYTLDPDFLPNYYFLSMAYHKAGDNEKSRQYKNAGLQMPPRLKNDLKMIDLLKKINY